MKINFKPLVAGTGIAALGALGLYGSATHVQKTTQHQQFMNDIETVLAMTPAQKDQTETAMQDARRSATPIRQELQNTNQALESAVRSDNKADIQRFASTEGQEIGQLMAIRSSAVAKVYKTLNPDQKQRAQALQQILVQGIDRELVHAGSGA